jgi:pilus assembly protein CpaE
MELIQVATAIQDDTIRQRAEHAFRLLPEGVAAVRNLAAQLDRIVSDVSEAAPDIVVADLPALGPNFGDTIRALRGSRPAPAVVVVQAEPQAGAVVEAMRAGAREFLYEGIEDNLKATIEAIRSELLEDRARAGLSGKLYAFVAAKGGCGLTTVVTHSAAALGRDCHRSVLLADLNLKAASVALVMHAATQHTLNAALRSVHRMDATLWSAFVSTTPDGVALAPPPAEQSAGTDIDLKHLQALLRFWKTQYECTFAVCGV